MNQLIDWAEALCGDWGKAKRQYLYESGYPTEATISRALQGHGSFMQHFAEVMTDPEVKACDAAIRQMEACGMRLAWGVVWCRFVFQKSVRRGSQAMGITTVEYREGHIAANSWIAAKVNRIEAREGDLLRA